MPKKLHLELALGNIFPKDGKNSQVLIRSDYRLGMLHILIGLSLNLEGLGQGILIGQISFNNDFVLSKLFQNQS